MKKLFALFFVFALIFYGANKAEASIWSDIGAAFGNFVNWIAGSSGTNNSGSQVCTPSGPTNRDWFTQMQQTWKNKINCKKLKDVAGCYAAAYWAAFGAKSNVNDQDLTVDKNTGDSGKSPITTSPVGGANIKDPGAAVGVTDPTLPKSPGDGNMSVPEKINFNLYKIFFDEALATTSTTKQKTPCDKLKDDIAAAKDAQTNKDTTEAEKEAAEKAQKNMESTLRDCCTPIVGGGGKGDGREEDKLGIETTTTTWPIGLPEPDPNPPYQYAACDYTSPDFNKMHKCVLKEKFEPGDIPCDVNQNQTAMVDPASMDQQSQQNFISKFTNWIAGLFGAEQPYVAGPIQVVYNPACYQGATPPPTGPTPPPTGPGATIPGQPVPPTPGDPGDPAKPVVTTTTTTKPRDPAPQWCQIQDFFWLTKNVFTENSEVKVKKDKKEHFTLIGYPKGGVLEQTGLDYAIVYCEECNMTIRSLKDEKDLTRFIKDNDIFTKDLEPMIIDEKYPLFWYSYQNAGQLYHPQVENLPIGQYELTITCKSKEGEIVTKSIRLSRLPVFRWREVAPISKND